jgi:hypothetical protein
MEEFFIYLPAVKNSLDLKYITCRFMYFRCILMEKIECCAKDAFRNRRVKNVQVPEGTPKERHEAFLSLLDITNRNIGKFWSLLMKENEYTYKIYS